MEFLIAIVAFFFVWSTWGTVKEISKKIDKLLILFCFCLGTAYAGDSMQLSPDTRQWFYNTDGSCVQCSIGLAGVHCNDLNAASLLWDTPYGPAERGGSLPSRVERYCDKRGIVAYSVTGNSTKDTLPWLEWACITGRYAACGAGEAHFQTVYGRDKEKGLWFICNNQTPKKIDVYKDADFERLHSAVKWVVILEKPSSVAPIAGY